MRDPSPSNITGEKVERHVFKHKVDWGHVAISLAVLASLYAGYRLLHDEDDEDGTSGPSLDSEDARDLVGQ